MTARKGKPEQNSPNGTSKTGQEDDGMQIRNARTGLPVHDSQYRTGQDFNVGLPRQDFQDMTSVIEEPEQILLC
jgi:hypothetical protein